MALRLSIYFIICFDSSYISVYLVNMNKRNNILTVSCYEMNSWACLGKIVQSLMRFGSWSGPTQTPNMDVLGVAGLIPSDNITAQTPHTNQVHDDSKWRRCGLLNVGCNMQYMQYIAICNILQYAMYCNMQYALCNYAAGIGDSIALLPHQ